MLNYKEDLELVLLTEELQQTHLELDILEIDAPDSDEWWNTREHCRHLLSQIHELYLG